MSCSSSRVTTTDASGARKGSLYLNITRQNATYARSCLEPDRARVAGRGAWRRMGLDRAGRRPRVDPATRYRQASRIEGALRIVAEASFLRAPRSASPGLLESNPWRRLTISEHRETSFLI